MAKPILIIIIFIITFFTEGHGIFSQQLLIS